MKTDLFDFELPQSHIALHQCSPRDAARLLVVDPNDQTQGRNPAIKDQTVTDLPSLLEPGDVLVLNDTRVIPAALKGVRIRAEMRANISCNLLKRLTADTWQALAKPAKKMHVGDEVRFGNINLSGTTEQLTATVTDKGKAGSLNLTFNVEGANLDKALERVGSMPIPPYIASKRAADAGDRDSYQTIFAKSIGAVAAPTAGLHVTQGLMDALDTRGIERHTLTLHVGAGTFLPVKVDDTDDHEMHAEWGTIDQETATAINEARAQGRRIVALGTTSLRLLESAAGDDGTLKPFEGETSIFIEPGHRFKAVDVLITNFHLPRSTLFMLVAAFAGLDQMKAAYAHAIDRNYRFYSYGDANLLFKKS